MPQIEPTEAAEERSRATSLVVAAAGAALVLYLVIAVLAKTGQLEGVGLSWGGDREVVAHVRSSASDHRPASPARAQPVAADRDRIVARSSRVRRRPVRPTTARPQPPAAPGAQATPTSTATQEAPASPPAANVQPPAEAPVLAQLVQQPEPIVTPPTVEAPELPELPPVTPPPLPAAPSLP